MDSLLTTGEVAKLCGVTPDAVLKWIKKGKLPATRTAGGHHRIPREACAALGLGTPAGKDPGASVAAPPDAQRFSPRCWEYFGHPGAPPEPCLNCLVYQARVEHCYKLAELGDLTVHRCAFCRTDCVDCPFYRAYRGLATTVLVITRDRALTRQLESHIDTGKVSLHFARTGYEASTLIGTQRPAVVVLDSRLPDVSEGSLAESIAGDDRIPGVKVFVAQHPEENGEEGRLTAPTVTLPCTAERIERLAESVVGTGRRETGDAA
jgi:excisionase family DNA binding protein